MVAKMQETGGTKSKILHAAAKLFLAIGFEKSTIVKIAEEANVSRGSIGFFFKDKEALLCELVAYVLEGQFEATTKLLEGKTKDKVLFYAAETVLQLHLAESSEHMREMYNVSYSMPNSANIIYHAITGKFEDIFKEYHPDWQTRDFYEREISTAGIMRNHMSVPCDIYFTMERKIKAFLEATFLVLEIPKEKIGEAVEFVSQFDWKKIAQDVIEQMLNFLESKIDE